ncbi:hypothetical protein C0J52_22741 [Blattella germanica]|nr:hypothetical protein C0J52_22741 [Blattella germanica]
MCCRPKTSFLIEDILQHSPAKTNEKLDPVWPTRPTPLYMNQVSTLHQVSGVIRMPPVTTPTRDVYVSDELSGNDRIRIHEYPFHQRHSHQMIDPLLTTAHYRGMDSSYFISKWPRHRYFECTL